MESPVKKDASSPDALRILCFGDSLTKGYSQWGLRHYPYGDTLQTELAQMLSLPLSKVVVHINGLSGDQVRHSYVRRMNAALKKAVNTPYDFIVVMGGTNDLGHGQPANVIYDNLQVIWRLALDSSAKLLALNIIEAAAASEDLDNRRALLNDMIVRHEDRNFYTLDLWSVIRYHNVDAEIRDRTWDDGLHLTEYGYDIMGKAVAARIYEIIQQTWAKRDTSEDTTKAAAE